MVPFKLLAVKFCYFLLKGQKQIFYAKKVYVSDL